MDGIGTRRFDWIAFFTLLVCFVETKTAGEVHRSRKVSLSSWRVLIKP